MHRVNRTHRRPSFSDYLITIFAAMISPFLTTPRHALAY